MKENTEKFCRERGDFPAVHAREEQLSGESARYHGTNAGCFDELVEAKSRSYGRV